MLAKILREPTILLRAPQLAFRSQVGDPGAIRTEHRGLWIVMRLLGRFAPLRGLGVRLSRPVPRETIERAASTRFPGVSVDAVVSQLRADGVAEGIDLPADTVQAIMDFARRTPFAVNSRGNATINIDVIESGARNDVTLGEYERPSNSPEVARLATDPVLLDVAERYLGAPPRHMGTRLWWSFPAEVSNLERSKASQLYHFDLDDFRFLKFFFYLTDVDEGAGPHIAVLGTHNRKKLSHQALIRRLSDEQIAASYGADRIRSICLRAGRGFAEDTFCLHKGQAPTERSRLLLQLEYGINDFHSGG